MAQTPSNMLPLGSKAANFSLFDTVSLSNKSLSELKGDKATVIFFICNHCPFVIHVNEQLVHLANDYSQKGVRFIAISSNDIENYPQDSPELMSETAKNNNYPFPYLYDESQDVAKLYDAACTPDNFVFDQNLELTYRGQLDNSRPGNDIVSNGEDIRYALDCILASKKNNKIQKPSIGCNIKWK